MRHIFLASLVHGSPRITKFEVVKETEKLLKVESGEVIVGSFPHWKRKVHKEHDRYFDDPIEAVEFLIIEQVQAIQQLEIKLDDAHDDRELLEELLKELQNPASGNEVNER